MRTDPAYRKITADEFLQMDFNTDRRFELHDGVIVMMAGGSEPHAWVQGNLHHWLRGALRGTPCRPYGPDMAVRVTATDVRYPDISIHCGPRPDNDDRPALALDAPKVLIEVLSPSTTTLDQGSKLEEYKSLSSVDTVAFVDPVNELVRTVSRHGDGWIDTMFAARDLHLPALDLTIPHAEIFADD